MERFAEETPLHGFAIAMKSHKKFDLIVGLTMVAICICMTVQQTVVLVNVYLSEPTAAAVSYLTDQNLFLDHLVISLPYTGYLSTKFNWNLSEAAKTMNITDFTTVLSGDITNKTVFDGPTINYLLRMFIRMAESESGVIANTMEKTQFDWNYGSPNSTKGQVLSYIHKYVKTRSVPMVALLKFTLSSICFKMLDIVGQTCSNGYVNGTYVVDDVQQIRNGRVHYDCAIEMCMPDNVAYFDQFTMAFRISSKEKPIRFNTKGDIFNLQVSLKAALNSTNKTNSDQYALFFDGKSRVFSNTKSDGNMLVGDVGSLTFAKLHIRSAYSFLNLKRKPCLSTSSKFDCENVCVGDVIHQKCNCWPIQKFYWKPQMAHFCGDQMSGNASVIPNFESCADADNSTIDRLASCQLHCLSECQSREYEVKELCTSFSKRMADGSTLISITIDTFGYSYIEESLLKDWQTFLNEFGGLVGVWMGGSLIAFVHVPMFLMGSVYAQLAKLTKKKVNESEANANLPFKSWYM